MSKNFDAFEVGEKVFFADKVGTQEFINVGTIKQIIDSDMHIVEVIDTSNRVHNLSEYDVYRRSDELIEDLNFDFDDE